MQYLYYILVAGFVVACLVIYLLLNREKEPKENEYLEKVLKPTILDEDVFRIILKRGGIQ